MVKWLVGEINTNRLKYLWRRKGKQNKNMKENRVDDFLALLDKDLCGIGRNVMLQRKQFSKVEQNCVRINNINNNNNNHESSINVDLNSDKHGISIFLTSLA